MKRWIPALLVAAAAAVAVTVFLASRRQPIPVETVRVNRGEVRAPVLAAGEIEPHARVDVSPQVIARIEKLHVKEGDLVRRGDRLVDLDRGPYELQRARAAEASRVAEAEVARAEAALESARSKRDRARDLASRKIASGEFLASAEREHAAAAAALAAARQRAREAAAAVETGDVALARTTIESPIDGRVVRVVAEEGETVVSGSMKMPGSVILTLLDATRVEAKVGIGAADAPRIRPGQSAGVRVDALPATEIRAEVVEVAGRSDPAGASVRLRLVDPPPGLKPGTPVRARIEAESLKGVLVVPAQAVLDELANVEKPGSSSKQDARKIVYRIDRGRAKACPVRVGLTDGASAEIVAGLREGETIAVGPSAALGRLSDGARVVDSGRKKG